MSLTRRGVGSGSGLCPIESRTVFLLVLVLLLQQCWTARTGHRETNTEEGKGWLRGYALHSLFIPTLGVKEGSRVPLLFAPFRSRFDRRLYHRRRPPLNSTAFGSDADTRAVPLPLQHRLYRRIRTTGAIDLVASSALFVLLRRVRLDSLRLVHNKGPFRLLLPQLPL